MSEPTVQQALWNFHIGVFLCQSCTREKVCAQHQPLVNDLFSAYRSALAGETPESLIEAAAKAMMRDEFSYLPPEAVPEDGAIDMEVYRGYARAAAPILRAPLLLQLQDKEERIKVLEAELKLASTEIANHTIRNTAPMNAALDKLFGGGK